MARETQFSDLPWSMNKARAWFSVSPFLSEGNSRALSVLFSGLNRPWAALEGEGGEERRQEETLPVKLGFD